MKLLAAGIYGILALSWRPLDAPRAAVKGVGHMTATSRQPGETPRKAQAAVPLSPQNQRLLAFLEKFLAEPDELGDAWWDEFRDWLKKNPVRFRGIDED